MTSYHLSIHKSCGSYTGMETFSSKEVQLGSEDEFLIAKGLCENRKNMAGFWKQLILPIRTDRASDLFFPTLMNLVVKIKDFSENFFVVLAALVWDLSTLPIRLMTFLPRLAYNKANATQEDHPLIPYLKEKGLSSIDVEGESPVECSVNHKKDGRVNILLYKKELRDGRIEEHRGEKYVLFLTDREIAFPLYKQTEFFSAHSLDGKSIY